MNLSTGSTSSGRSFARLQTSDAIRFGAGRVRCSFLIKVGTLSDGTNRYRIGVGFGTNPDNMTDQAASGGVYLACFQYSDNIAPSGGSNGEWRCVTSDGSTIVAGDSNVNVTSDGGTKWYLLEVEVNDAGDQVDFYINGVLVHSATGTSIPTSSEGLSVIASIIKTAGGTSRSFNIDSIYVGGTIEVARY
jgi:hypothetical protein